jgi:hypothetical protein
MMIRRWITRVREIPHLVKRRLDPDRGSARVAYADFWSAHEAWNAALRAGDIEEQDRRRTALLAAADQLQAAVGPNLERAHEIMTPEALESIRRERRNHG